jgi:hypothetical protein
MANDILSMYGKDVATPQAPRASSGGVTSAKSLEYCPPQGPSSQTQVGPGIHGTNHGNNGTQGKR